MIRGQELAQWLARTHPALLAAVARKMPRRLGDDGLFDFDFSNIGADITPVESVTTAVNEASWADFAPTLVDVTADLPQTFAIAANQTPTFDFSSLLSAAGKAVSSPAAAPSSVGSFLSSPQGLTALANTATAYFKSTASQAQAQTQNAVLSTQLARAAAGQAPAPIGYTRNPYTGALTPILGTSNGVVPLTQPGLASLVPSSFFSTYGLWIIGGLAVVLLLNMRQSAR